MIQWWNEIQFDRPWVIWFLFIIPLLAIGIYLFGGKGRPKLQLSSFRYLKGNKKPARLFWRNTLHLLRFGALAVLLLAIARPQSRMEWKRKTGQGIDIILCMDISESMEASDLGGLFDTRIAVAKKQASNFISQRPDDRIGLVVFSGETFAPCPLTTDHDALKVLVENVHTGELTSGTHIGMGLAKSVERLRDSKAKSKVIVLLTDGENNGGSITPIDAGRLAKTFNIRVYTIGLGATSGQVLSPTTQNPDGSYVQQYQDVNIDESTLIEIAAMNGGKYFRAGDGQKLEEVYKEINRLEKSDYDKKDKEQRKEEYMPFILFALALLIAEFVLRYTVFDTVT
jgi:Ca-activated chloride channel homolog